MPTGCCERLWVRVGTSTITDAKHQELNKTEKHLTPSALPETQEHNTETRSSQLVEEIVLVETLTSAVAVAVVLVEKTQGTRQSDIPETVAYYYYNLRETRETPAERRKSNIINNNNNNSYYYK
ncbi:unnamed protein product [Allacma fusca]|uniref:Uncharacterized protein n=1 Tax=Allacma fusca TaxID=39272 RepID=A0A8J2JTQ7_9HEXA|nr:unnamed protein product [Allacma fusca]